MKSTWTGQLNLWNNQDTSAERIQNNYFKATLHFSTQYITMDEC